MASPPSYFRIPERQHAAVSLLARLSEEDERSLEAAIATADLTRWPILFTDRVATLVEDMDEDDVEAIASVLFSLYRTYENSELDLPAFLDAVENSVRRAEAAGLESPEGGDWSPLRTRIERLFQPGSAISIVAKAGRLARELPNTYHDGHIYTDLRPAFGVNPQEPPSVMLVVHNLKITYHEGTEHKEIQIALDAQDVTQLRSLLDRAEKKASGLRALMEPTSVLVLEE